MPPPLKSVSVITHLRGRLKLRAVNCRKVSQEIVTVWPNMIWPMSTVTSLRRLTASATRAAADEKPRRPSLP